MLNLRCGSEFDALILCVNLSKNNETICEYFVIFVLIDSSYFLAKNIKSNDPMMLEIVLVSGAVYWSVNTMISAVDWFK